MFLRVSAWAAVVGVWTTVALAAVVLPEYESDAVSERQEGLDQLASSLCELMPDLPGCQALNDTLSFEGEGSGDVKEKQPDILPSTLHHHKTGRCTLPYTNTGRCRGVLYLTPPQQR
ncbi:uncharacterized protein LOC121863320 [Homarus americanus]|uniref:uncharacterized protein LOC121863320 n=1 Tax=Homarus americanus TaxID=6706 RepID=UPI001C44A80C|nr:uncharacterized protein LOC121863320 [Homarus americanus]